MIKTIHFVVVFIFVFGISIANAKHKHPEKYYQYQWCEKHNGEAEVILSDKTRCDCLTNTHAIEVDFATKWAESIGQALYYSSQTGKLPGILLIIRDEKDQRYINRIYTVIKYFQLPITVWTINE